jgi:hypothetical protein
MSPMTVLNVMPECLIFAIAAGANQSRPTGLKGDAASARREPDWRSHLEEIQDRARFRFFSNNQSQVLDEAHSSSLEGWKLQSICKSEASIA